MQFLHAASSGDYLYLWSTDCPLIPGINNIDKNVLEDIGDVFSEILSGSDLVPYNVTNFSISVLLENELKTLVVPKAVMITGSAFVDLCSSFRDELEEKYTLAPSFLFWNSAAKLLLRFLSRGLYFPSVRRRGPLVESRWELYWKSEEVMSDFKKLAELRPGIAIFSPPESGELIGKAAASRKLESFFINSADDIIRSFLRGSELFKFDEEEFILTSPKSNRGRRMDLLLFEWAKSLVSSNSTLDFAPIEQTLIAQRIEEWNKNLRLETSKEGAKLRIEIISPELNNPGEAFDKNWLIYLKLVLPSGQELVPGENIEKEEWTHAFLREVGRAIEVSRVLDLSLRLNFSSTLGLKVEDVYQLVSRDKSRLEQSNIEVIPPSDWLELKSDIKVVLKLKPNAENSEDPSLKSAFSLQSLVDFSWNVAVDGYELTPTEVADLIEKGSTVIYKDGKWLSLDRSSFKAKIEEIKNAIPQRKLTLFEALRLGLGGVDSSNSLDILRIDADGWIREILNFAEDVGVVDKLPASFKGELRPYQLVGLSWLNLISKIHIGGCLADDMGLGKTIQVLALLAMELEEKQASPKERKFSPNLLVVPMSILGNWESEAKKFVPDLKVYVHHGSARESGATFSDAILVSDLVITTYSILYRDYRLFRKHSWFRVILDEAQNIKNVDAKQTKAVRALLEDYSLKSKSEFSTEILPRRLALTGTPLENRLTELWSILDFLNPGLLGSIEDFKKRFVNQIEKNRDTNQARRLGNLIKPFILRRTKLDPDIVADLPEKIEMNNIVHLTPEQARLYQDTLDDMIPKVKSAEGFHRKGIVLSTITRLKQICVHPELVLNTGASLSGRSGKLEFLEDTLETVLAQGDKVLVFTQFAKWGALLTPHLTQVLGKRISFFHGGLSKNERDRVVNEFQSDDGPPVLVLSLKAGGFGLNLTAANQVIHLDQWWNPAVQSQATDRAYRIGQKNNVQVRTLISKGTLEEKISEMHKHKIELTNSIVETTKSSITELSMDALEELLKLNDSSFEN